MRATDWLFVLAFLPSIVLTQHVDICSAKPKDLPLEPRCIYRSPDVETPEDHTPEPEVVPESTNPRVKTEENIFMSPISISTAFAMTKLGACNRTLEQIMKVFQFDTIKDKTSDQVHFFFAKLNCRLYRKKDETTELVSANQLFGEKSLFFNETFQNISEMVYGAKLMPLNFKIMPEQARITINNWISNKTEGRIKDTLPTGVLDSNTILVLVNTIYFKGQWKKKFDKKAVFSSDFQVSSSRTCQVNMMFQETKFKYKYFPEDAVQVLEMPYRGDDITMVIILPSRDTPLSQVEESLDLKKLNSWLYQMTETSVSVSMPRFNAENASLPGILEDDSDGLFISNAYHKAFLEVNEEGSEAAAATVVLAVGRSFNPFREVFQADRPFLLFIRESTINALLFSGRVVDPCDQ
ncbi:hypothetical protein OJAV_G00034580 [Oryzias javanicus]|uniref:Antithrombin-III n=1 Tax=Oryzias javanicus TaxID=123683 RepID=A0A437DFI5_ORYJA|nr:hypothetical protein OJAV_G00034580 [Oryzias javanicus]